jgi:hypothetical protein
VGLGHDLGLGISDLGLRIENKASRVVLDRGN